MPPATTQAPGSGSLLLKKNDSIIQKNKEQVILSSQSIERIQQQHQLLCDTVIKKRSVQNGQTQHHQINIVVNDQSRISEIPGSHVSVANSAVDITSQESYQRQLQLIKSTMSFWDHSQSCDQTERINFLSGKLQRQIINVNGNRNDFSAFQETSQGNIQQMMASPSPAHHSGNDTVIQKNSITMPAQQIRESINMRNKHHASSGSGQREHDIHLQVSKAQSQFEEQSPMFLPSRLKVQESMSNSRKQSQVHPQSREASQEQEIVDVLDSSKYGELRGLNGNQNRRSNEKSHYGSFQQNNYKDVKLSIQQGRTSLGNSVQDELPTGEVHDIVPSVQQVSIIRDTGRGSGGIVEFDDGSFTKDVKGQYSRREELQGPRSDRAKLPERIHQNNADIAPHLGQEALQVHSPPGSHETSGTQRLKREGQVSDFSGSKRSSMLVNYKNHRLRVSIKGEGERQAHHRKQLEQQQQSPQEKLPQHRQKLTNSNSQFHKACPKSISPPNGNKYYVNQDQLHQNLLEYTRKLAESMDKEARRRKLMEVTNEVNQDANGDPSMLKGERGNSAFAFARTPAEMRRSFSPTSGIPRAKRAFKINNMNQTQPDMLRDSQLQRPEDQRQIKGLFSRISSQFRDAVGQQYGDRRRKPQSTKHIVYTGIRSGDDTTKSRKGHIDNLLSNFSQYHKYEQIKSHRKASNGDSKVSLANKEDYKEDGLPYFTLENSEQESYEAVGQEELRLPACVTESSRARGTEDAVEEVPALNLNSNAVSTKWNDSRAGERLGPSQRTQSGRLLLELDSESATASGAALPSRTPVNAAVGAVDSNSRTNMQAGPVSAQDHRRQEVEVKGAPFATAAGTHFQAPQVSMLGNQNQTYLNRTYEEYQEQEQNIKERRIRSRGGLMHTSHMLSAKGPKSTASTKHVLHANRLLEEQRMLRLLPDPDLLLSHNNSPKPENIRELARNMEFVQSQSSFKGAMFNVTAKSYDASGRLSRSQARRLHTVFSQNQMPSAKRKAELLGASDHSVINPAEISTSLLGQSSTSFFRHRVADRSQSKPLNSTMFHTQQHFGGLDKPSTASHSQHERSNIAKKYGRIFDSKLNKTQFYHSKKRFGNIKKGRVALEKDSVQTQNGIQVYNY